MKKLSLTLGAIVAVAAPVATVVSCEHFDPNTGVVTNITVKKSDIKFYGPNGYGKIRNFHGNVVNYDDEDFAISSENKNLSNGDNVKITIKSLGNILVNEKKEYTFDIQVSGLAEKKIPLSDNDLKNPSILSSVRNSLIDYSKQKQSDVFYSFSQITKIPNFVFNEKITTLPDNIDFSSLRNLGVGNFQYLKKLPNNIDLSNLEVMNGNLTSITSFPENIDISNLKFIYPGSTLKNITSLPESIRFHNELTWGEIEEVFPNLDSKYDESWFNVHRNPATTTTP